MCVFFLVVDGLVVSGTMFVVADVDIWVVCLIAFLQLCGILCLIFSVIMAAFDKIGTEFTKGAGAAFTITVVLQLVSNFSSQGVWGIAPWVVASALVSSSVVGYVLLATLDEKENAKADLELVLDGPSEDSASTRERPVSAILDRMGEQRDEDTVRETVNAVRAEDTVARKVDLLERFLTKINTNAKRKHLSAVVTSEENLRTMMLTPKMFEEERTLLSTTCKSEMPVNDVVSAIRYLAKTCTPEKVKRRILFARARRSYVVQGDVDKIERLWKISRECHVD